MALSGLTIFEVRTSGSDTNGGGFVTGQSGVDWSQQNNAQYSVTDGVTNGTTTITSASANFGTDVVGNIMYVAGGTGSITGGWYQITTRNSSSSILVDRAAGLTNGTGVTLKIGGALASPGLATMLLTTNSMKCYIKSGTYNIITSNAGPSGPLVFSNVSANYMEGYDIARGDRTGNQPIIKWAIGDPGFLTYLMTLSSSSNDETIRNITFDGNNTNRISGISAGGTTRGIFDNCLVRNFSGAGQIGINTSVNLFIQCVARNCATGFSGNGCYLSCIATGSSSVAFNIPYNCWNCIAYSNSGVGFIIASTGACYFCIADSNASDGFSDSGGNNTYMFNCVSTNNLGYGYNTTSLAGGLFGCADYNNSLGRLHATPVLDSGAITLTTDPYINRSAVDYRLNSKSGGGVLLQGKGYTIPGQTDSRDIGAVRRGTVIGTQTVDLVPGNTITMGTP